MSRRQTITYTCDECGRQSIHEMIDLSHLHNGIFTTNPYPRDWEALPVIGTTRHKDVCHACQPKAKTTKAKSKLSVPTNRNAATPVQTGPAQEATEHEEPHCPV